MAGKRRRSDPYLEFLDRKSTLAPPVGIDAVDLNVNLKPFQRDITQWALKRGRAALFEGTGLGKTLQQLSWADVVQKHTQGEILDLTPLAVAQQTCREAVKFGIEGVSYAPDAASITSRITISNYDRLDKFDISRFAGVILDESSIIKAHDSQTRIALLEACADVPYRLACTATPAPNDWIELGNHAEFLGVMSQKEMLAMFFVHEGSIRADPTAPEWRLKRHAERAFWEWVASWAVMIRHPRDLGYDEPGYDLPPLIKHQITVPVEYKPTAGFLFPVQARTLRERIAARRDSIPSRVAAAAAVVNGKPDEPWLIWCGLNDEADALIRAIPGAEEVRGSHSAETKTTRLLGFSEGRPLKLVSKASIAGFGMNWQHCANVMFVGVNDSFEQLFQAIRRCWRFGQTRDVNVYLVASELEGAVVTNLEAKERDFDRMAEAMAAHMIDLTRKAVRGGRQQQSTYFPTQPMEIPEWLTAA